MIRSGRVVSVTCDGACVVVEIELDPVWVHSPPRQRIALEPGATQSFRSGERVFWRTRKPGVVVREDELDPARRRELEGEIAAAAARACWREARLKYLRRSISDRADGGPR